jgi:hypothetical protein
MQNKLMAHFIVPNQKLKQSNNNHNNQKWKIIN